MSIFCSTLDLTLDALRNVIQKTDSKQLTSSCVKAAKQEEDERAEAAEVEGCGRPDVG